MVRGDQSTDTKEDKEVAQIDRIRKRTDQSIDRAVFGQVALDAIFAQVDFEVEVAQADEHRAWR